MMEVFEVSCSEAIAFGFRLEVAVSCPRISDSCWKMVPQGPKRGRPSEYPCPTCGALQQSTSMRL